MEKYEFIVLPPDAFHMTLRDRLVEAQAEFSAILAVVDRVKLPGQRVLVKYRSENQRANFPCARNARVGYGQLLKFCARNTTVIGPPNSAAWECWLNDIAYYPFWNHRRYAGNKYLSVDAIGWLSQVVYIACNAEELHENLVRRRIFKPGKSKRDLLHRDGLYLQEIVARILQRRKRIA